MLKNAYFWNKNVKITSSLRASPPGPHVITFAYYCKFVEFISCANCILLPSKDNKITTVNVLLLLLLQLLPLFFISNSIVFVDCGVQEYFLPQGAVYPSYATA